MIIELTQDIPVGPEHGMKAGRQFEVVKIRPHTGRGTSRVYVRGDSGEEVALLNHEYKIIGNADAKVYCRWCGRELKPAPAKFDGEPAYVGWMPCPDHNTAEYHGPFMATVDRPEKALGRDFLPEDAKV